MENKAETGTTEDVAHCLHPDDANGPGSTDVTRDPYLFTLGDSESMERSFRNTGRALLWSTITIFLLVGLLLFVGGPSASPVVTYSLGGLVLALIIWTVLLLCRYAGIAIILSKAQLPSARPHEAQEGAKQSPSSVHD